jgi:hypothetical protein
LQRQAAFWTTLQTAVSPGPGRKFLPTLGTDTFIAAPLAIGLELHLLELWKRLRRVQGFTLPGFFGKTLFQRFL